MERHVSLRFTAIFSELSTLNSKRLIMMSDPIQNRVESIPRPSLTAASVLVCLAAVGLWLSALGTGLVPADAGISYVIENALYYLPFVALPILIYSRRRAGLGEAMRLNPLPLMSIVTLVLLGLMSVYLASTLAAAWGALLDGLGLRSVGGLDAARSERELALSIVSMAALPAVCEELLFRGVVLSAWETRGTAFAIGVSAALFALIHGNLYGLPVFLLVGGIAGFVTFATNSVYAGMVYHTVYNAACLVISYRMAGQAEAAETAVSAGMVFAVALEFTMLLSLTTLMLVMLRLRGRDRLGVEPIPRIRRPLSTGERLTLAVAVLLTVASTAIIQVMANG